MLITSEHTTQWCGVPSLFGDIIATISAQNFSSSLPCSIMPVEQRPDPPSPTGHHSAYFLYDSDSSQCLVWVEKCRISPPMTGVFLLAPRRASTLWCLSELPSFLRLDNFLWRRCTWFHLLMHRAQSGGDPAPFLTAHVWFSIMAAMGTYTMTDCDVLKLTPERTQRGLLSLLLMGPSCDLYIKKKIGTW